MESRHSLCVTMTTGADKAPVYCKSCLELANPYSVSTPAVEK